MKWSLEERGQCGPRGWGRVGLQDPHSLEGRFLWVLSQGTCLLCLGWAGRQGVEPQSGLQQSSASFVTVLGCQLHPSDGVARQRGSDVRGGLLICQPPADTWLRLFPAYPEEGRRARCLHIAEPRVHLNERCKKQPGGGGSQSPLTFKPAQPHAPHSLHSGLLLAPPCRSPPHSISLSPNHRRAKCSGEKRSVG